MKWARLGERSVGGKGATILIPGWGGLQTPGAGVADYLTIGINSHSQFYFLGRLNWGSMGAG